MAHGRKRVVSAVQSTAFWGEFVGEMQGLDFLLKAAIDNHGGADPCHRNGIRRVRLVCRPTYAATGSVLSRIEHTAGSAAVTQLALIMGVVAWNMLMMRKLSTNGARFVWCES